MKYSRDHAWVELQEDGIATVGITSFAAEELGEISFIELPDEGLDVQAGEPVCSLDSLKSTSDIYAPVSGTVVGVNAALGAEDGLRLINEDPTGKGWVFIIKPADTADVDQLLDEREYAKLIGA